LRLGQKTGDHSARAGKTFRQLPHLRGLRLHQMQGEPFSRTRSHAGQFGERGDDFIRGYTIVQSGAPGTTERRYFWRGDDVATSRIFFARTDGWNSE